MSAHIQNKEVIKRLRRANGHMEKVIQMLESDTECLKVAQQLKAVVSAMVNAKQTYIRDHIEHCLQSTSDSRHVSSKINEFKEIAKYL